MEYISVAKAALTWGVSERSVRNYCAEGRVEGAYLRGKTWMIPFDAEKPKRKNAATSSRNVLSVLRAEKAGGVKGGLYHRVQIDLAYNSNRMEGSKLSHDQTRFIFETATIGFEGAPVSVDDIVETSNHFRCVDFIIERADARLTPKLLKELHRMLKTGTTDASKDWFAVGEYKQYPNEVAGRATTAPGEVAAEIAGLIDAYEAAGKASLADLIEFHVRFERIHPFQDGNGRVGRLILFKECLRNGITPFIIGDDMKFFYYRGLAEWDEEKGYLTDTCLAAQDRFKAVLEYFRIPHDC